MLTCLYCFETFAPHEIQFRCINPNPSLCGFEPDEPLQRYRGFTTAPSLPKVVYPGSGAGFPTRARCSCGVETSKAICPRCHNELPHQFGQTDNCIIALIGAKQVGKSHYVTVLIHELKNRIGDAFNLSLTAQDEQTIKRYKEDFSKYIYGEDAQVIPGTLSARARPETRYPLVYQLSLTTKRLLFGSVRKTVSLVFFDTAGEDLGNIDIMATETKYIANADGIIFLLDPLQVRTVVDQLPPGMPLPTENNDQAIIIERATRLIQQIQGLGPKEKVKIPVSIAFSKIDALRTLVDPLLLSASFHPGYVNLSDFEQINEFFRAYVHQWFGPNLLNYMNLHYRSFSFFGLSALGDNPDHAGKIKRGVHPFRIEDPLLWILHEKGIVNGKKIKSN
ncbi:MAG: GTPase domain-containing protein [bacterium]